MARAPNRTKSELRKIVSAARQQAEAQSLIAFLDAVGPDLTLGELLALGDDLPMLLGIRCAYLSKALGHVDDEPMYGIVSRGKKKTARRRKVAATSKGNGRDEDPRQSSLPGTASEPTTEPSPGSVAPPRPEDLPKSDTAPDDRIDQRVLSLIEAAGDDGAVAKSMRGVLGCTKGKLRASINRLRKAEKIVSVGEKSAQRHHVAQPNETTQQAAQGA